MHKRGLIKILSVLIFLLFNGTMVHAQESVNIDSIEQQGYYYMLQNILISENEPLVKTTGGLAERAVDWQQPTEKKMLHIDVREHDLWLVFIAGSHIIYDIELFESSDSNFISLGKTGMRYPFYTRPYPVFTFAYNIVLSGNQTKTYLLKINREYPTTLVIPIIFLKKEFKAAEQRAYITFGFFTGIIILVGLFNLFLFFVIKEKIHLPYFIYSLAAVWLIYSQENLDFQFFYPGHPEWYMAFRYTAMYFFLGSLLWVMQLFLKQSSKNSRVFLVSNVLKIVLFLMAVVAAVLTRYELWGGLRKLHSSFYWGCQGFTMLLVIYSCIEKIIQGFYLAWFYLIALLMAIGGAIMSVLLFARLSGTVPMPPTLFETGLTIEAVIISFGILFRYNYFKKEKEKLAQQLQEEKLNSTRKVLEAQVQEQKSIAEDLHDELGSSLAALKLRLQNSSLQQNELQQILNVVDKASNDTRNISHHLMPPEFEQTSFHDLLSNYYTRLNSENSIKFDFVSSGNNNRFTKQEELVLYRIMMELTANILKHSHATEATIQMIYYEKHLEMMIEDNGKGFATNDNPGIGLRNIQSRVNYLDGEIRIDSNEHGTTVIIQIPYKII
jgi:signal transduction histidine kinase